MNRIILIAFMVMAMPQWTIAADDILTTAASNGSFNTLVSLVVAADLDETLQSKGEFTVFAPTDEAFAKLPKETLAALLKPDNREQLASILKYHVLPQEISVPKRPPSHPLRSAKTLLGEKIKFDRQGTGVKVNGSKILIRNIRCSNGLIHVIDAVLMPPKDDQTIVGVAQKAGNFKTLLAASEAAGLVEVLAGKGPLTVFAPTDKAFKALPSGTVESLLKPENKDKLANILKYHVVKGKITAQDAVQAGKAKTLASDQVRISIRDGRITINDANVISNDIEASNGIIHVIDQVLLPGQKTSDNQKSPSDKSSEITFTANWSKSVDRDGIQADRIIIRCTGGGSVRLTNVAAKEIVSRISGGGRVTINGTVFKHNATVNGGAVLKAKDLVSNTTDIQVNGGGNAEVNATDQLNASAFAGATLRYVETDASIKKSINKYASFSPLEMKTAVTNHH